MISEIDIRDWEITSRKSELYNLNRNTVVSLVDEPDVPFVFSHIDGMYSQCQMLDGTLWHPAAWTDVFLWSKKS